MGRGGHLRKTRTERGKMAVTENPDEKIGLRRNGKRKGKRR